MNNYLFKRITSFPISKRKDIEEVVEVNLNTITVFKEMYSELDGELVMITYIPLTYKGVKSVLDHAEYKYSKALQFPEMFDEYKVYQLSETVSTYKKYVENFEKNLYGSFNHMSK